jgi:hypothetical protein
MRDLAQRKFADGQHGHRIFKAPTADVTVRGNAHGRSEHSREVERAEIGQIGQAGDGDLPFEMLVYEVKDPAKLGQQSRYWIYPSAVRPRVHGENSNDVQQSSWLQVFN